MLMEHLPCLKKDQGNSAQIAPRPTELFPEIGFPERRDDHALFPASRMHKKTPGQKHADMPSTANALEEDNIPEAQAVPDRSTRAALLSRKTWQ